MLFNPITLLLTTSGLAAAANICGNNLRSDGKDLVVSLGSSYSAGVGLNKNAGNILADLLGSKDKLSTPYSNYANCSQSGSKLKDAAAAAKSLGGLKYKAVILISGGNDLDYVLCLGSPTASGCPSTETESTYVSTYTAVLDAIRDHTTSDTQIYAITYIQALGDQTVCPGELCNLSASQEASSRQTYTNVVNWTVDSINTWKKANPSRPITMVPMRSYSSQQPIKHYVGQKEAWISGSKQPAAGDGAKWHPNKAGHNFIANAVFNLTQNEVIVPQAQAAAVSDSGSD